MHERSKSFRAYVCRAILTKLDSLGYGAVAGFNEVILFPAMVNVTPQEIPNNLWQMLEEWSSDLELYIRTDGGTHAVKVCPRCFIVDRADKDCICGYASENVEATSTDKVTVGP